jgi:competence transcription factor ComK
MQQYKNTTIQQYKIQKAAKFEIKYPDASLIFRAKQIPVAHLL